jgi:hypothetical protein
MAVLGSGVTSICHAADDHALDAELNAFDPRDWHARSGSIDAAFRLQPGRRVST